MLKRSKQGRGGGPRTSLGFQNYAWSCLGHFLTSPQVLGVYIYKLLRRFEHVGPCGDFGAARTRIIRWCSLLGVILPVPYAIRYLNSAQNKSLVLAQFSQFVINSLFFSALVRPWLPWPAAIKGGPSLIRNKFCLKIGGPVFAHGPFWKVHPGRIFHCACRAVREYPLSLPAFSDSLRNLQCKCQMSDVKCQKHCAYL